MSDYTKIVEQAGDQALESVKRAYGIGTDAVSTASEWIGGVLPKLPEAPYASELPTPRELAKVYFDFVQNLTKLQRDYVMALIDATEPVTKKVFPAFSRKPAAAKKAA